MFIIGMYKDFNLLKDKQKTTKSTCMHLNSTINKTWPFNGEYYDQIYCYTRLTMILNVYTTKKIFKMFYISIFLN